MHASRALYDVGLYLRALGERVDWRLHSLDSLLSLFDAASRGELGEVDIEVRSDVGYGRYQARSDGAKTATYSLVCVNGDAEVDGARQPAERRALP